jgi:hypothetical protein
MRNRRFLTVAALVSSVAAAGCDGGLRVRGRVVDAAGIPVATALIHLEPTRKGRQFEEPVAPDGCFSIGHVVAPGRYMYRINVTAEGFKPVHGTIRTIDDNRALVVLRDVTDSQASTFVASVGEWPKNEVATVCETNKRGAR